MKYDWVNEIEEFNIQRNNLEYNRGLEFDMLAEELSEYILAKTVEDEADALGDIIVVAVGSLLKLVGGDKHVVDDIMLAITAANSLKPKDRINGKIVKGSKYVAPEPMIRKIILGE